MHSQGHVQVRINPWIKMQISNVKSRTTAMQLHGCGETSFSNSNNQANDFLKIQDSFKYGGSPFKNVLIYSNNWSDSFLQISINNRLARLETS